MYKAIRYIGSKQKILPFLEENLLVFLEKKDSKFFEGFVGTGIVSQFVAEKHVGIQISGSDISGYSRILFNILNFGQVFPDLKKFDSLIEEFIQLNMKSSEDKLDELFIFNEFSAQGTPASFTESRNFFHEQTGKTIDNYRAFLKNKIKINEISQKEADILLYFILAYACKMANTTSVFGAFLKSPAKYKPFTLKFCQDIVSQLDLIRSNVQRATSFYEEDIVKALEKVEAQTVIYLDPPYSTRRYESNYHILNFIVDLDFTPEELKQGSKTGQPLTIAPNPFGQKKATEQIFRDMIRLGVAKSEVLGISYNSDGIITQSWMEQFCAENSYQLKTCIKEYKRFKSKVEVTNTSQLQEILWIIQK